MAQIPFKIQILNADDTDLTDALRTDFLRKIRARSVRVFRIIRVQGFFLHHELKLKLGLQSAEVLLPPRP